MRERFAEALKDGTLDEMAIVLEEWRARRVPISGLPSPVRPASTAVDVSPRPLPSLGTAESTTIPYGTPLQQRLSEAFAGVELDDVHINVDEPLEIDFESMAARSTTTTSYPSPDARGLFLRRERTNVQEM